MKIDPLRRNEKIEITPIYITVKMSLGEGKLNLSTLPFTPLPGESPTISIDNIKLVKLDKKYIYVLLKNPIYTNIGCLRVGFDTEEKAQEEYTEIINKVQFSFENSDPHYQCNLVLSV